MFMMSPVSLGVESHLVNTCPPQCHVTCCGSRSGGAATACAAVGSRHSPRKIPQALPHLARLLISHKGLLFPCGEPACGDAVMHMSRAHESSLAVSGFLDAPLSSHLQAWVLSFSACPFCSMWMLVPRGQVELLCPRWPVAERLVLLSCFYSHYVGRVLCSLPCPGNQASVDGKLS